MNLPPMALVEQTFDAEQVADIPATVQAELDRIGIRNSIRKGQSVAISAGSRGITDIAAVVRAVVDVVKSYGGSPFVFPGMGTHAGATAEGQQGLLARYGITAAGMGCPIRATMDVDVIGQTPDGLPVRIDRFANQADHIIVLNRVKPHTKFEGPIGSGLMKMMTIGMGKKTGAQFYHNAFLRFGMRRVIETVGQTVMANAKILCGLGLVENAYDQTAILRAALPADLLETEKGLLVEARRRMARIPFPDIDLLIVDEMGKNVSGTGMDTNVTGVNRDILGTFTSEPRTRRLFVRDLTPETEGNAVGIGLADFTTRRLVDKIDYHKTYVNCLAGISPEKGAVPIHFETDRECIDAAIHCLGMIAPEDLRIVHIRNTMCLGRLHLSRAYLADIEANDALRVTGNWRPMSFGDDGNLVSPFAVF